MSRKIKSIRRFNQNYKNFNFSDLTSRADEEYLELTVLLDANGNSSEEIKYLPTSEVEEKSTYEYDTNGKLATHTLLYAIDNFTEKRVLTRNEKGLLISEVKYYSGDSGEKTDYEYNEKDNVTAIIHHDEEGEFVSREEIIYDEKGGLTERCTYDINKKTVSRITFTNPGDNQIEEIDYDANGAITSKTIIIFNDKGKEISSVQTNPQGKLITSVKNTYDDRGNIIEKIYKDFYSKKVKFEYNDKDLLMVQELFDEQGLLLRKNMYEYDDDKNVIAEQTYEMDTTRGGRDKHFGTRYEYEFF